MALWVLVLAALLGQTAAYLESQTCTDDRTVTIQGGADAMMGGIISQRQLGPGDYGCGLPVTIMQAYEALRFALELVNKKNELLNTGFLNDSYVPGIRLGMKVIDDCSNIDASVAAVSRLFPTLQSDAQACTANQSQLLLGLVGTSDSASTKLVSEFANKFHIPLVSYMATATDLTVSGDFPNFQRTIPPDDVLLEVMGQVLVNIKWQRIVVVYEDFPGSRSTYESLRPVLAKLGICLTAAVKVDGNNLQPTVIQNALRQVVATNTTGVLFLGGRSLASALLENGMNVPGAGKLQWIFTDSVSLESVYPNNVYPRGVLVLAHKSRYIVEFEDHWVRLDEYNPPAENPWYASWYMEHYQCNIGSSTKFSRTCSSLYPDPATKEAQRRSSFVQDQFVEPAVLAVFTYAAALRKAQVALCGASAVGMCQALREMTHQTFMKNYLRSVNLTFTTKERIASYASVHLLPYNAAKLLTFDTYGDVVRPVFSLYNYNDLPQGQETSSQFKFREIGTWIGGSLTVNLNVARMYTENRTSPIPLPPSLCPPADCYPCLGVPQQMQYYYSPGDIVINGVFSLHDVGTKKFSCGKLLSNIHPLYLEAMIYAVKEVNTDKILQGVTLGGLGIDDCMDADLSTNFIMQVQTGMYTVMTDISGADSMDPRTVEAYTAAHSSPLSIPLAGLMDTLMQPMVGYKASSAVLDQYKYYLKVVPSMEDEFRAIIMVMQNYGWRYTQVLYTEGTYSYEDVNLFRRLAAEAGICVVASYEFEQLAASGQLAQEPTVRPVVLLLSSADHRLLLAQMNMTGSRSRNDFIATPTFASEYQAITAGYQQIAEGYYSINIDYPALDDFTRYLGAKDAATDLDNPWLEEWYENAFQCNIGTDLPLRYTSKCVSTRNITSAPLFQRDPRVLHVINGVRAIARGLHALLTVKCGTNYRGVCSEFLVASRSTKGTELLDKILGVTFNIKEYTLTSKTFMFNPRTRGGVYEFVVYNFRNSNQLMLGSVTPSTMQVTGMLPVAQSSLPSCDLPCTECLYMFAYQKYWYIDGDLILPAVFDVHYQGLSQFYCGDLRASNGVQYTEAFKYALDMVNSGILGVNLTGVRLGGLAFDGCTSPARSSAIINGVMGRRFPIMDNKGKAVDVTKLVSWLTYDSESTMEAADALKRIRMPVVSPGATAPQLLDKDNYSTFFRTIPSDTVIARAMVNLFKHLHKTYVVTLNAPDVGSRETKEIFRQYMQDEGLCVVASFEFETDGSVDVILDSINATETTVVAVFADPDRYVPDLLRRQQDRYPMMSKFLYVSNRYWALERMNLKMQTTGIRDIQQVVTNSFSFRLSHSLVPNFLTYLQNLQWMNSGNPWLPEYYQALHRCDLGTRSVYGVKCSGTMTTLNSPATTFFQDMYTLTTINAVHAVAVGLDKVLREKCSNPGVCGRFLTDSDTFDRLMWYMDRENFTDVASILFRFVQREANRGFDLMRHTGERLNTADPYAENVAVAAVDGSMTYEPVFATVLYDMYKSECPNDCIVCKGFVSNFREFSHLEGDLYIVGLFDVHTKGATPYTCGGINKEQGSQLLEAFNAAISYINEKRELFQGRLKGVRIGGVGIDVCQSPNRAANMVANIQSGNIPLRLSGGVEINRRQIMAYVGPFDTHTSIAVADILSAIAIPQISFGASGLQLQDPVKYPYFLRSVPADDKQSRAIISFLKNFNMSNVQVISSYETVGQKMRAEFKRLATLNLVCIKKEYVVKYPIREAASIINQIVSSANDQAKVVILLVNDPLPILQAAGSNDLARTKYLWVATDKWGYDLNFLTNIENLLGDRNSKKNVIIFDIETADVPNFDLYLDGKTPDNYFVNPWFEDFYNDAFKCTWSGLDCDKTRGIPRAEGYIQDPYVLYVTNAVLSAGIAIDQALSRICSEFSVAPGYDGMCLKFEITGNRRDIILEELKKVNYTDNTLQPFYYEETGQSSRGYHIYNITSNDDLSLYPNLKNIYENVGSYNDTDFLKLDITYNITYEAYCKPYENCVCENPFPEKVPSRYMLQPSQFELNLVYIGDIHQPHPTDPFKCSSVNIGSDFYKMMAFFYAIDRVNGNLDNTYPGSLQLGGIALDTCSTSLRLDQDIFNLLGGYPLCDTSNSAQVVPPSSIIAFVPDGNGNSISVSRILASTNITSLSPSATSPQLREFVMSEHFLSVVPMDDSQAALLLKLLKDLSWDYASIIYSNNPGMVTAKNELLTQSAQQRTACMGQAVVLPMNADIAYAERVLDQISQQVGARAVILFTTPEHTRLLLQATENRGQTGRFVWIGTSSWARGAGSNMLSGLDAQASGSIIIQPHAAFIQSFRDYIKGLTFTNRRGIPDDWFEEIYQTLHQCKIHTSDNSLPFSSICSRQEVITDAMVPSDPTILHTVIAVYMVAQGLNDIQSCQVSGLNVAACITSLKDRNGDIYQSILNAEWNVLPAVLGNDSFSFTFNDNGYGNIGFDIFNYRSSGSGGYVYSKMGSYKNGILTLDRTTYGSISVYEEGNLPKSICIGSSCQCKGPTGVYGLPSEWTYSPSMATVDVSVAGRTYYDPVSRQSYFVGEIPSTVSRFNNMWGVAVATLAAIGVFVSVALFLYLLVVYPVRGGTSILGYILSFGIILLYGLVFAFVAHASTELCGLRRFCLGFCYSICYCALFVKLVDCWRSKEKEEVYDVKYNKLGRPLGFFCVTFLLVLVQVMINAEWLILEPPKMIRIFYYQQYWPRCTPDSFYDEGLVLSLCYIMFIILLTIILGLMSFNSTKNHREARWILGIAVLSVPAWVVWCAWSILGAVKTRDAAVAIGLLINATILLLCGPVRKLYLLNKYQALIEEEDKELQQADRASKANEYSSAGYNNQYDNAPEFHDRASGIGSSRGPYRYQPSSVRS